QTSHDTERCVHNN
ncbi:hypothetical protein D047_3030B, partial [Vibrio parahaemolyticus VPTS-2010_2]